MMVFEITYRCREKDEDGQIVEGENCCRLRAKEEQVVDLHNHGRYALSYAARGWVEEAIAAVERLQGREYVPGSICDIRLAKKED